MSNAFHTHDVVPISVGAIDECPRLTENREELRARLLLQETSHARVHIRTNMSHVDADVRMVGFVDDRLGGTVEVEPRDDQIVIAASRSGSNKLLYLLSGHGTVLRAKGGRHCRPSVLVAVLLPSRRPSPFGVNRVRPTAPWVEAAENHS